MSEEEKTKRAQEIYDAVLLAFPQLRQLMINAQATARKKGYVETILGRRRHLPDMQLPEFEFVALPGYVNPDINPLDPSTLVNKDGIPERIVKALKEEFASYKYFGQIAKRTRELRDEGIKVINNRSKITEATRQCVNCVDTETEILTFEGWKKYNEISPDETVYGYDVKSEKVVEDKIHSIYTYSNPSKVIQFSSKHLDALSTLDHRWIVNGDDEAIGSEHLKKLKNSGKYYFLPLCADNEFKRLPHELSFTSKIEVDDYTHSEIVCMSQGDAQNVLIHLKFYSSNCVYRHDGEGCFGIFCKTDEEVDILQHLCVRAGYSSYLDDRTLVISITRRCESTEDIVMNLHSVNFVWCVQTSTHAWIARRHGKVYITGNSIVQGQQARPVSI